MDEESRNLIRKYSEILQDFQKKVQALTYSLQRACEIIAGDNKKDAKLLFNLLEYEGKNKVEVFYGTKDNEPNL